MIDNVADLLALQRRLRPAASALSLGGRQLDYDALDRLVWRIATALARAGAAPGDVLALTFADDLLHMAAVHAIARLGATAFGMPSADSPVRRRASAAQARAVAMVTDLERVDDAGLPVHRLDLQALADAGAPVDPGVRAARPVAPWLLIQGSGSTGRSKLIPLTHACTLARVRIRAAGTPVRPGERVLSLSSMDFSVTRQRSVEAVAAGAETVLAPSAGGRDALLALLATIDVLHATPLHARRLLEALGETGGPALPRLRMLVLASAPSPPALRAAIRARLTPNLWVPYSANEVGLISVARPDEVERAPGFVGRPVEGVTVEVVDDAGRPLPPGRSGRIRVRSRGVIDGYRDDPQAQAAAFRDGWFLPGDVGALDDDGALVFDGRADDMMVFDGINVFPAEIEAAFDGHPDVAEAAAFALPSAAHHDLPFCAVVPRAGASPSPEALRLWARERLGMRAPQAVLLLDALPRTPNGKLARRALVTLARARLAVDPDRL